MLSKYNFRLIAILRNKIVYFSQGSIFFKISILNYLILSTVVFNLNINIAIQDGFLNWRIRAVFSIFVSLSGF
ncbi:30S ribosomal protein S16 [Polaribacter irgensii 23-P]|uniref:30S ribosomal protein S16 n=1 Tax=Polaribacter irgensii 23-P TaxID=313594 RepID=A4BZX7_9FLAO|nr:30S ribosomal protein S16 [Polaribacter irgensii 23-P]